MSFNDFWGSRGAQIDEKSIKNRLKFEAQDEVPLGIDLWRILVGFGSKLGGKTEPKWTEKRSKKASKIWCQKSMRLEESKSVQEEPVRPNAPERGQVFRSLNEYYESLMSTNES